MLACPLEDRVLLYLKVRFSLPPLVNGQTPSLKRTRPRHTTRRDNLVHLGHEVAVIDRRQSHLENVYEGSSLFIIDVHIVVVIPLRIVTSICSGCCSYLLPVFHGVWSKKLRVNFQFLISETRRSRVYRPHQAMEQRKHKGRSVRRTTAKVYKCGDEGRYGPKTYRKQGCTD